MAQAAPSRSPRLDAEALARLSTLKLRVERVVDGVLAGLHRSPHHGASIEFAEHKEYSPGDDLRRLDWKALAKFDRHYIRRYEDETELAAYLLLDTSGSMGFGAPLSKLDVGAILVAALAFLLARQRDQAALLAFSDRVATYVPPRARANHLASLLVELETLPPTGQTRIAAAVDRLLEVVRRRSLVVIVSDLFEAEERTLPLLRQLRSRGHQVVVLQLLHADELSFPFSRVSIFTSLEDDQELLADPAGVRAAYLRELAAFCARVEAGCREGRVRYQRVSTADPLDRTLVRLLERRLD
ncbi:MAG: DUF58 domain-containing protein [Proteobacteria bacterium]|nr:MAG: DUF58 domain-containing protein [Pseudomonadota bacterium]